MDLEQIRRNIVWYKGYKSTNDQEMKVIENSILESVATYFRPVVKDIRDVSSFSKEIEEDQRKEQALKEFNEMKQVSSNFSINELVFSFMSKAHNDWILEHKEELENNSMKKPEKFVPIELLTEKEINEYMLIAGPIFESLEIAYNEQEVKKAFNSRKLIFMIKNEIFSNENLEDKLGDIERINPGIIEMSSDEEKSIQELLSNKEVIRNVAEHVKPRVNLNISDIFRKVLKQNNEVGYFTVDDKVSKKKEVYKFTDNISQKKIGFKKHALPRIERPITKAVYQLARFGGVIFAKNVKASDYKYYDYSNNAYEFIRQNDCSDEQKRAIERRNKKLNKLIDKFDFDADADNPGVISMVVVRKYFKVPRQQYLAEKDIYDSRKTEIIQIPITKKELVEMRILPDEVGWEKDKKARIQSSNKTFLASPYKRLQEKNDFKESLLLVDKSKNINNEKTSIESTKNINIEENDR